MAPSLSVSLPITDTTSSDRANDGGYVEATQGAHPLEPVLELARRAMSKLDTNVDTYSARIVKRERIGGRLGEESVVFAKIKEAKPSTDQKAATPLHVYLRFDAPKSALGREVIWVDGKNDGKIIAHEAGMLNVMRAHLDPKGVMAMLGNRYPYRILVFAIS